MSTLANICDEIDELIDRFHPASELVRSYDFLLPSNHSAGSLNNRACLIVENSPSDEMKQVGIYLSEELKQAIATKDPRECLEGSNIDPFLALVEEISHLHLICHRNETGRVVTQFELEWQAEIDKVFAVANIWQQQVGECLILRVHEALNEGVEYISTSPRYPEATHYSTIFWSEVAKLGHYNSSSINTDEFLKFLRTNYDRALQDKFPFSQTFGPGKAA